MNIWTLAFGAIQLGLIYSLLAMGIYISFRILNTPDLTAEGSFTLGMAVMATATVAGHPLLGLFLALLAGALAGLVTAFLQTKLEIPPILAGILTMTGLYTLNLVVMGGASNVTLIGARTLYTPIMEALPWPDDPSKIVLTLGINVLVIAILTYYFKTNSGLCIRALGDNEAMARASSIHVDRFKSLAFMLSNALIAVSGALIASDQGFADMNAGAGMLVVGLAAVIIGETFVRRRTVLFGLISCMLGSVIYRFIIAAAIRSRIFPSYGMKLMSALIVTVALALPALKRRRARRRLRKENIDA